MPMRTMAPLAGRDDELADIRERISGLSGGGGTVLVAGDMGMGKSTLLDAVAREVDTGSAVLRVSCASTLGSSAPFAAVTTAVRHVLRHRGREGLSRILAQVPPLAAAEVGRLMPDLGVGDLALPELASERDRATRSIEAFATVASAAAKAGRRTVIIVDDIHWIDEDSFAVLHRVAAAATSLPILVVVSYRTEDMGARPELAQGMRRLRMVSSVQHDLGPLDSAAVGRVAGWYFDRPTVAPKLARWLTKETAGNPFHLTEALRATVEAGVSLPDLAHNPQLAVPSSVKELLRARLGQLDANERAALQALDVSTIPAGVERVAAVAQLQPAAAVEALASLVAKGLAARTEAGLWQVAHDQVRQAANEMDAPETLRAAHLRLAGYLEAAGPGREDELAHHLTMAGQGRRAIGHLLAAARTARKQAALFTAHSRFQQVRAEMASHLLTAEWKFGVLAEHEELMAAIPLRDEQHATLQEMGELAGGDVGRQVSVLVRRSRLLIDREGGFAEAVRLARQAVELVEGIDDSEQWCEAHQVLGHALSEELDPGCREVLEAAAEAALTPQQKAEVLAQLGWALHFACDADPDALDVIRQASAIAEVHNLIDLQSRIARVEGSILGALGHPAEATAVLKESVRLAEQVGARHSALASMKVQCLARWFAAEFQGLDQLLLYVADQARAIGETFTENFTLHIRSYARAAAGDVKIARDDAERVMAAFEAKKSPHAANVAHTLLVIALNDDDPELAEQYAARSRELAARVREDGMDALAWAGTAEVALYHGDADEVLRLLDIAASSRDAVMSLARFASVAAMRAWALARRGDTDAAEQAIATAAEAAHEGSDRAHLIHWLLMHACQDIGDHNRAAEHRKLAQEWAERVLGVFDTAHERDMACGSWPMREIVYGE